MEHIKIFFQGEGLLAFESVTINDDSTASELLEEILRDRGWSNDAEWLLFVEDSEQPIEFGHPLHHYGIKNRHHVHVHHCKSVEVSVTYNNVTKTHSFSPATTVAHVKDHFVGVFTIDPIEAPKLALFYGDPPQIAEDDHHIGSYAARGSCAVAMNLAPKVRPQG